MQKRISVTTSLILIVYMIWTVAFITSFLGSRSGSENGTILSINDNQINVFVPTSNVPILFFCPINNYNVGENITVSYTYFPGSGTFYDPPNNCVQS